MAEYPARSSAAFALWLPESFSMGCCCFSNSGAYRLGLLVNCNTGSRSNWFGCNYGWHSSSLGILFNYALVENPVAKLKLFPGIDLPPTRQIGSWAVAILLLLAVTLLCAYELCAVYVTTGPRASDRYSPSGFFFGVSAIALAINMLFICRMVFNGNGLDVDEYVRRAYKFAYSDQIELGPVTSLPEPPDPNELYPRQSKRYALVLAFTFDYPSGDKVIFVVSLCLDRASHLVLLYVGSLFVLLVYSILYGLTAKEANWLGAVTSVAVIILGDLINSYY
ncbi:Calpain-type cysteine protease dek1 [Stylosanthes scabra]|uniref:Calpain-type cysteine protease dek1 n=1 Tax=Stylosanthes scabra TaxID=79078 RepID=A0ABU6S454_9FABA|nr:Calpain-type cysteine protease dek1 [Stylosanthes scabra]